MREFFESIMPNVIPKLPALWNATLETLAMTGISALYEYAIQRNHRFQFQQSTQYDHVECFGIIHFIGCIHCVDAIHFDIFTRRRVDDTISVVNQDTARLYLTFEFLQ